MKHALEPRPGYPFSLELSIEYIAVGERAPCSDDGDQRRAGSLSLRRRRPSIPVGRHGDHRQRWSSAPPGERCCDPTSGAFRSGAEPVEGTEYDFRRPKAIGATKLDHAFTDLERGEDGLARVQLGDPRHPRGRTLWVDQAYPYLMLFTGDPLPDVARRSLAVEPMTCPPNAFRTGEALIRLEPGESFTGAWGIVP